MRRSVCETIKGMVRHFVIMICALFCSYSAQSQSIKHLLLNSATLERNFERFKEGNLELSEALKRVLREADRRLTNSGYSVVNKNVVPKGGTKNDFLSFARYYWYDAATNKLIRVDGKTNSRIDQIQDQGAMNALCKDINILGLAYYYSKDEKYAIRARYLLKRWFLDSDTKMNPNMEFSQVITLEGRGRSTGIVSAYGFISLIDGVLLFDGSKNWSSLDSRQLKQWFSKFLDWMINSELGRKASQAKGNIGSYYDAQVIAYYLYIGRIDKARDMLTKVKTRIEYQFDKKGLQPLELGRANSYKYSVFNLEAHIIIARLAKNVDVDLLSHSPTDCSKIIKGLYALLPYSLEGKKWPHNESGKISPQRFLRMVRIVNAYPFESRIPVKAADTKFNYNLMEDCIQILTL